MFSTKLAELREERAEDEKGFTLIELLVVVVIIGVLVAIAIPLYLNYRTGAQNRSAQSDVRNAVSAVESCIGDNAGVAPPSASGPAKKAIGLTCTSPATTTAAAVDPASVASYQQVINVSDGVSITYTKETDGSYTILGKYGSNTKTFTYTSKDGKTV